MPCYQFAEGKTDLLLNRMVFTYDGANAGSVNKGRNSSELNMISLTPFIKNTNMLVGNLIEANLVSKNFPTMEVKHFKDKNLSLGTHDMFPGHASLHLELSEHGWLFPALHVNTRGQSAEAIQQKLYAYAAQLEKKSLMAKGLNEEQVNLLASAMEGNKKSEWLEQLLQEQIKNQATGKTGGTQVKKR